MSSKIAAVPTSAADGESPTRASQSAGRREPLLGPIGERRKKAYPRRGPRVRMLLPDGQHLEVTLVSWHQYRDGSWRARVRWPVWGAYGFATEVQTRVWAMESFVPASMLGPVDGQDYGTVRRDRPRVQVPKQQ
ncbi:hypothetical protein [Embleya scabrispora]|uniref:hypothetical protein n=1 Tax=Embleya scabrispora TaxID=159449 RepID=UPI00035F2EA2|nr:hypothetical protein [Embleya scabrispora]MYS83826.1 hypothetical protein [Streptomyces sp. SID5474]